MRSFDWSKFTLSNDDGEEMSRWGNEKAHEYANEHHLDAIFAMTMQRFEENFMEFTRFYDVSDPRATDAFMHMFTAAVVQTVQGLIEKYREQGRDFDEVAVMLSAAGFGFILGRTWQEFEVKRIAANGELSMTDYSTTSRSGVVEI